MNGKQFLSKKPSSSSWSGCALLPSDVQRCSSQQDELGQQTGAVAAAGGELWPCHGAAGRPAGVEAAAALPALQVLLQTG